MRQRALHRLGTGLTLAGVLGLLAIGAAYLHAAIGSRAAIASFEAAAAEPVLQEALSLPAPNQSNWSRKRVSDFESVSSDNVLPLAILEIDRLNMKVPVYHGTDRVTLNRGAGLVEGTAYPGERGNMVLSAHRDGFFRALKDIREGDQLRVRTLDGSDHFVVEEIFITDPLDVSVLDGSDKQELTLITCYPFYYIGFAPKRMIVRATATEAAVSAGN